VDYLYVRSVNSFLRAYLVIFRGLLLCIETRFVCDSSLLFSSVLRNALLQHPSHPVGYNLVE
jgi:hypothetical protein